MHEFGACADIESVAVAESAGDEGLHPSFSGAGEPPEDLSVLADHVEAC